MFCHSVCRAGLPTEWSTNRHHVLPFGLSSGAPHRVASKQAHDVLPFSLSSGAPYCVVNKQTHDVLPFRSVERGSLPSGMMFFQFGLSSGAPCLVVNKKTSFFAT
jgi:hypothetical protein